MFFQTLYTTFMRMRNRVDYPLRQIFQWRMPGFYIRPRPSQELFAHLAGVERERAEELAARLYKDYHLEHFYADSTPLNYRENLYYLDLLVTCFERASASLPESIHAADIGPSHWFYVQALYAGLKWWHAPQGRAVTLTAFEIDAYRIYADLHSRYDHALAHMRQLPAVHYLPRAFTRQPAAYDLITMFFPFVFEKDHLEWGLPDPIFHPQRLLEDAWASLKPGGWLVMVNQGEAEHLTQLVWMKQAGIQPVEAYRQDPLLFHYDIDRYILAAQHG